MTRFWFKTNVSFQSFSFQFLGKLISLTYLAFFNFLPLKLKLRANSLI